MTRPRKLKVDWFPHSCTHGKTMFVLEKKFGLKGYVFWFKLLEILGDTEGHFIDLNDPATKEFVQAYTAGEEDTEKILDTLAALDAIDIEAWEAHIIWSMNFIKGIAQTYINRRVDPPARPDNYIKELHPGGISTPNLQPIIQEGKGREEKGREGLKDIAPSGPDGPEGATHPPPPAVKKEKTPKTPVIYFFRCAYFDVDLDYRMEIAKDWPALDDDRLLVELKKARDWLEANAHKKKFRADGTYAPYKVFLRNWFNKIDDITGPGGPGSGGGGPKSRTALKEWAEEVMRDGAE